MNDKEFNRSILAKLYEIADKVFVEGVNVPEGSYTAFDLVRLNRKKPILKKDYITTEVTTKSYLCGYNTIRKDSYCEVAPIYSIKVGNFEASFCASKIFALVTRFEKLAGFGKAKQRVFTYSGNDNTSDIVCHEAKEIEVLNDCAPVEENTPCKAVSVRKNELPKQNECANEKKYGNSKKTNGNSKRFSLYEIGLINGDTLQFVDGQTVTVCSDKKVAYEGKVYALSGFTKSFILKPNRSGSYRGIMYFYKGGVRLDKYAAARLSDSQNIEISNNKQDKPSVQQLPTKEGIHPVCAESTEKPQTKESCTIISKTKTVRFEAGKKLSAEEKREVLSTLHDAYKENGVHYHIEETHFGREKRVYDPGLDDYVVSDITGRRLHYLTLPDGRIAHPTELFPNISDKDIMGTIQRQTLLDNEVDCLVRSDISFLDNSGIDKGIVFRFLVKLQEITHETRDIDYRVHNAVSCRYKQGVFISDVYQALSFVRSSCRTEFSVNVLIATQKAVAKCFGMVDNLISRLRSMEYDKKSSNESNVQLETGNNDIDNNDTCKPVARVSEAIFTRVLVVLINIVCVCGTGYDSFALRRMPGYLYVGCVFANSTCILHGQRLVSHKCCITPVCVLSNPPPYIYPRNGNKRAIRRLSE